jgi:hypothetical protein
VGKHDLLGPDGWPLIGTVSGYLTEDEEPTEQFWAPMSDELDGQTLILLTVPAWDNETTVLPGVPSLADEEDEERRHATDVALDREGRTDVPFDPRNPGDLQRLLHSPKHWPSNPKRKDDSR